MQQLILMIVVAASCFLATTLAREYKDHTVLGITMDRSSQVEQVKALQSRLPNSEFWRLAKPGMRTDLMVGSGEELLEAKRTLDEGRIPYEIMIEDVQKVIDERRRETTAEKRANREVLNLESFNSFDDITKWLDEMALKYPTLASTESIGETYEGREMKLIKIGTDASNPIVWLDGGIHAREWLSPATVTWFVSTLLTQYSTNSEVKTLVDSLNWHILPVHNPDGYEYSRSDSRLWRKTRQPHGFSSLFTGACYGADPNRNWDSAHGTTGISLDGCSDIYCGPKPESEPCVENVVQYLEGIKEQLKVYFTFHTYGQMILLPYGYTDDKPADYQELSDLARDAARALQSVHGTQYTYGSIPDLLYPASGGSIDYVYDTLGVKYSFAAELRDTGRYGFLAPSSEIRPTAEETWQGLKTLVKAVTNID